MEFKQCINQIVYIIELKGTRYVSNQGIVFWEEVLFSSAEILEKMLDSAGEDDIIFNYILGKQDY